MKKLLLLLLALTLSLTLLTACNNNDDPPTDTDTEQEDTNDELTTADILGFDKQSYGEEFLVLLNESTVAKADFFAEEGSSDRVSIATYDRNLACEEYLGISLQYVPKNAVWNSGITNELYTLVSTGSCDYDMAAIALNAGIMGGKYGTLL